MNFRILAFVAVAAMAAAGSVPVRAQDAQPAQPAPKPTQPASTPTHPDTIPADANSAGNSNGSASSASPATTAKNAPKRVWTDDDMNDLRSNSQVSIVGTTKNTNNKAGTKPGATPRTKSAQYYHDQITKLQAGLPPIDEKMKALKDAIEGKPVTEARKFGWTKPGDWHDALAQLQKQRDDINARIAALEDQARRSGVPQNQIP